MYLYLSQNIFYDATIILQFDEPLFILITFIKPNFIIVLKKLHFGVFMGESLSPPVNESNIHVNVIGCGKGKYKKLFYLSSGSSFSEDNIYEDFHRIKSDQSNWALKKSNCG